VAGFLDCVKQKKGYAVQLYLKAGFSPNVRDSAGWTPLMCAAAQGDLSIATTLLQAKADVNAESRDSADAYHVAVKSGYLDMAAMLVETGAHLALAEVSAFHLAEAKRALADGYDPDKPIMETKLGETKWGRVADARKHLESISQTAVEYPAAQALFKEVARREKKVEADVAFVTREALAAVRTGLAGKLEVAFLSSGMDVSVKLSGEDETTIRLVYVLWSRPLIFKLLSEGDFRQNLRNAGFRKLIFDDKYENTWSFDLTE